MSNPRSALPDCTPRPALVAGHPTTTARSSSYPPPLAATHPPRARLRAASRPRAGRCPVLCADEPATGNRDPAHEAGIPLGDPAVEPVVVARHPLQREPALGGVAALLTVDIGHPLNCADHLPLVTAEVPGPPWINDLRSGPVREGEHWRGARQRFGHD